MTKDIGTHEAMILAQIQAEVDELIKLARGILAYDRIGNSERGYLELVDQLEQRITAIPEQARDRILVRILGVLALALNASNGE